MFHLFLEKQRNSKFLLYLKIFRRFSSAPSDPKIEYSNEQKNEIRMESNIERFFRVD